MLTAAHAVSRSLPLATNNVREFSRVPRFPLGPWGFRYGFMKEKRQQLNNRRVRQIISRLKIEMIDVNAEVARKYGLIFFSLERKGAKIPINDV